MNDYYYDNSTDDNTFSGDKVSRPQSSWAFSVHYTKVRAFLLAVIIFIPLLPIFMFRDMFADIKAIDSTMVYIFVSVVTMFMIGMLFVFVEGVGKKLDVFGNSITIRKWFLFTESISLYEVSKCEVITGLTVHSRYGTRHYNKVVLHYSGDKTISFTDDVYENWNQLVNYMSYNGKAENIDGTSRTMRFIENLFKK